MVYRVRGPIGQVYYTIQIMFAIRALAILHQFIVQWATVISSLSPLMAP